MAKLLNNKVLFIVHVNVYMKSITDIWTKTVWIAIGINVFSIRLEQLEGGRESIIWHWYEVYMKCIIFQVESENKDLKESVESMKAEIDALKVERSDQISQIENLTLEVQHYKAETESKLFLLS